MEHHLNLWEVLRRTAVWFSRIWPRKVAVLLRTAVRFSKKFHFMEHHSGSCSVNFEKMIPIAQNMPQGSWGILWAIRLRLLLIIMIHPQVLPGRSRASWGWGSSRSPRRPGMTESFYQDKATKRFNVVSSDEPFPITLQLQFHYSG